MTLDPVSAPRNAAIAFPDLCEGCGKVDADPKLFYGPRVFHHDCVPFFVKRDLFEPGYYDRDTGEWIPDPDAEWGDDVIAMIDRTKAVIAKAESLPPTSEDPERGQKLRQAIFDMHEE